MGISLSFICACGDDDEEPVREPEKEESLGIIGTWRYDFSTGFHYIYFGKAGYGWENEYDEADGGWYGKEPFTYVYDDASKKIVIKWSDGYTEILTVSVLSQTGLVLENYADEGLTFYERISDGEYETGDEEIQKPESGEASNLVGTWRCDYGGDDYEILYFDKSGEGWERDYYDDWEDEKEYFSYVYNESSKKLFIYYKDEYWEPDEMIVMELTDTILILRWENFDGGDEPWDRIFYRQK